MNGTEDASGTGIGDYATEVYHQKRLHGGVVDAETELMDFRKRWLSPGTGVWLSRDPDVYQVAWNWYQCLEGDPLTRVDPDGARGAFFRCPSYWEGGCQETDVDKVTECCTDIYLGEREASKECREQCDALTRAKMMCREVVNDLNDCFDDQMDAWDINPSGSPNGGWGWYAIWVWSFCYEKYSGWIWSEANKDICNATKALGDMKCCENEEGVGKEKREGREESVGQ